MRASIHCDPDGTHLEPPSGNDPTFLMVVNKTAESVSLPELVNAVPA